MGKCYHNYLFTILLGVAMALDGCAPSKTEIEKSIQGRWQRVGAPNVHDPFQTLATEYIELRSNGVIVSLLADSAPRTFWTTATGAYSVPQVGQIIVQGKCWQGWKNYDCSHTYRFELNQDHLVIFDDVDEGRSVEYTRFGPNSVGLPPTLAPPMPSATPKGQLGKPQPPPHDNGGATHDWKILSIRPPLRSATAFHNDICLLARANRRARSARCLIGDETTRQSS